MTGVKAFVRGKRLQYAVAFAMTVVFVLLRIWDPAPLQALRLKTFDVYQRIHPHETTVVPLDVV